MTSPATVTAGESFGVSVTLKKSSGAITTACDGKTVTLHISSMDGAFATGVLAGGVVSWPELELDEPGTYTLSASLGGTYCSAASDEAPITVESPGVQVTCPSNAVCTASLDSDSGNASAAITAGPGATITAAFGTLDYTACGGSHAGRSGRCPDVRRHQRQASQAGPADDRPLDRRHDETRELQGLLEFADQVQDGQRDLGDRAIRQVAFTGNLPNCLSKDPTLPCILLRTKNSAGDVSMYVIAKPGDPKGYISK